MAETREDLIIKLRDIRRDIEELQPSVADLFLSRYGTNYDPSDLRDLCCPLAEASEALKQSLDRLQAMGV